MSDLEASSGKHRLSTGAVRPQIDAISWLHARAVLPDEARDFTPWLADNLHLLAPQLGLEELTLVTKEWSVQGYSLDIRARGIDSEGEEVAVVVENQYSKTDHRHLGQLL